MTNTTTPEGDPADVTVVIRDSNDVEYVGTITVTVTAAASYGYEAVIEGAAVTGSDGTYYILNGAAQNVTLKITGDAQKFAGTVSIYQQDSTNFVREPFSGTEKGNNVTEYTIPVDGVGSYVIEILNVDGQLKVLTLSVIPVSTGSVGLIVVGN